MFKPLSGIYEVFTVHGLSMIQADFDEAISD